MRSKKINGIQEILDAASRRQFIKAAGSLLLLPLYDIIIPDAEATNFLARPAAGGGGTCPPDGSPSLNQTGDGNVQHVGLNIDHWYGGQINFNDAGSARTVCKVQFYLTAVVTTTITGITYKAEVFTMSGNNLNTQVALSNGVSGVDAWNNTPVVFEFAVPYTQLISTNYGVTFRREGAADTANYVRLNHHTTAGAIAGSFATWQSSKAIEYNPGASFDCAMGVYYQA